MSNSVKAYLAYRAKRKELQASHKQLIESELEPWKRDLGEAIILDRANGLSMDEISDILGNKNRNMLYAMVKLANPKAVRTKRKPEPETVPEVEPDYILLDYNPVYAYVQIGDDTWKLYRQSANDPFTAPDEWALGSSDERKIYKRILGELNT